MNKYLAIIDRKTIVLAVLCATVTYMCFKFSFSYNLNVTLFSIAIIFPLVFTIREAFKRRDNAIKLLSIFKSSITVVHHSFDNNSKLPEDKKAEIRELLNHVSDLFISSLKSDNIDLGPARSKIEEVFTFVKVNRELLSQSVSMKIFRFMKDAHEGIENTAALKMHGTPISFESLLPCFHFRVSINLHAFSGS